MYKNGKRIDNNCRMSEKLDKYKPNNIYKGKLDVIIDENSGSATLGFLDLIHTLKNVLGGHWSPTEKISELLAHSALPGREIRKTFYWV